MINFSAIPYQSLVGRALREPLRLVPKSAVVRILQGPLRGQKWIAGSSNHGCWLGTYELAKVRKIAAWVKPGMVCFDIGANVGYYTLLFSKLVGEEGRVIAFEPVPENVRVLERHLEMNGCRNVSVMEMALSDFDGTGKFARHQDNSMGRLAESGTLTVKCGRLDTLIGSGSIPVPDVMKIDVEGAELAVLSGAQHLLGKWKPMLLLETHGDALQARCCQVMRDIGYSLSGVDGKPATTGWDICGEVFISEGSKRERGTPVTGVLTTETRRTGR